MQIFNGDMFEKCQDGDALCVTTNGILTKNKKLVMGAGIAKVFRDKFNGIDALLGKYVEKYGNRVFRIGTANIGNKQVTLVSFPTKHDWKDKSDIKLIEQSCIQLKQIVQKFGIKGNIYIPAPGCNNGGLDWETQVKPVVEKYLEEDKYIICFKK